MKGLVGVTSICRLFSRNSHELPRILKMSSRYLRKVSTITIYSTASRSNLSLMRMLSYSMKPLQNQGRRESTSGKIQESPGRGGRPPKKVPEEPKPEEKIQEKAPEEDVQMKSEKSEQEEVQESESSEDEQIEESQESE